jgi:hypothetical protein
MGREFSKGGNMSEISPLMILGAIWVVVTLVLCGLLVYRSFITMKEEDTIFLGATETPIQAEQREIQNRLQKVNPYIRTVGYLSLALGVLLAGAWIYRSVVEFMSS